MDATHAAFVQAYWPVLISTMVFIFWCARLESKVLYLEKDREEGRQATTQRETVLWSKLDNLQSTVTELVKTVAKLEGKLENKKD